MDRPQKRSAAAAAVPSLPDDAVVEILSRVPAKSLCRFKCVSKGWRDLISDRLRCKKLPQTLEGFFCDDYGHFINTLGRSAPLVDASFSFLLQQLTDIEVVGLLHSCNGLLLFGHKLLHDKYYSLGYIVCNPATEQWVAVPSSGWTPFPYFPFDLDGSEDEDDGYDSESSDYSVTYLLFDPAVSSHFQLVQIVIDCESDVERMHTYSSQTGVWSKRSSELSEADGTISLMGSEVVCGMLHLRFTRFDTHQELIVAVDGQGKKRRIMSWSETEERGDDVFLGQSQGLLHYVTQRRDNGSGTSELCVWVLQDYDAEEWVLKHSASFVRLFGRTNCVFASEYDVVAIHPDRNVIFFVQRWDRKLKSYDMDSEEVCTLRTLGQGTRLVPYVPYFAESSVLAKKAFELPLLR